MYLELSELFQGITHIRYFYGPFPLYLCQLDYLLKNILVNKLIIFFNFGIIVRYIFVFHSKNPTAYQDDFWSFILKLWAYSKSKYLIFIRLNLYCSVKD